MTNPDCRHCLGAGIVFQCPEWIRTRGECCPHGTHKVGCPGETIECPSCSQTAERGAADGDVDAALKRLLHRRKISLTRSS